MFVKQKKIFDTVQLWDIL